MPGILQDSPTHTILQWRLKQPLPDALIFCPRLFEYLFASDSELRAAMRADFARYFLVREELLGRVADVLLRMRLRRARGSSLRCQLAWDLVAVSLRWDIQ